MPPMTTPPLEGARLDPLVDLPLSEMVPPPGLFLHPSTLHGQIHVARVMIHATLLAARLGMDHQRKRLWASVYLHDIARRHDGVCHDHGARAILRWPELEAVQALFSRVGIGDSDMEHVVTAVTHHSKPRELDRTHRHWELTSLLKDADGLDRVRLGDLDVNYLRHEPSKDQAPFAQELFERTAQLDEGPELFGQVWHEARVLLMERTQPPGTSR
jgi:hypothetical protein